MDSKTLAERPRRILEVLNLPQIAVTSAGNFSCIVSIFKGLVVLIHPAGAHLRLGVRKEVYNEYMEELKAHGFDGDVDAAIAKTAAIQKATRTFWENTYENEQAALRRIIPAYDTSPDGLALCQPVVEGPASVKLGGRYWRGDLLGNLFATSIGGHLQGYYGSYEEAVLRELSVSSPLRHLMELSNLHNKNSEDVRTFYMSQVVSERLALDFQQVEGYAYPVAVRREVCLLELTAQGRNRTKTTDDVLAPKTRTSRSAAGPAPSPPVPRSEQEVTDLPVIESELSQARRIMNQLNLPRVATRVSKTRGEFILSLFLGTVVLIDPSGLYIKLFVKPGVYEVNLEALRAAGLNENPAFKTYIFGQSGSAEYRRWWNGQGEEIKEKLSAYLTTLPVDQGEPILDYNGGQGTTWMNGWYWRADILPYLLWSSTGARIPGYRGSSIEAFLNEERLKKPLCDIMGASAHLTIKEKVGREHLARVESSLAQIPPAAPIAPVDVPQVVDTPPSVTVGTVKAANIEARHRVFREHFIARTTVNPPLLDMRAARNFPRVLIDEAWVTAERLLARGHAREIAPRDAKIAEQALTIDQLKTEQMRLLTENARSAQHKARMAVPQFAGAAGEEEAGPLINLAGKEFGQLTKHCGEKVKCADFIHEDLLYGFILHEVKNGTTPIHSADGVNKLLRDVEECEKARQVPCVAAILYSFRSVIANHNDQPMVSFRAPNGHTLVICVNNIREQVDCIDSKRSDIGVFRDATSLASVYIQSRLQVFFDMATHQASEEGRNACLQYALNIKLPNQKILEILDESENVSEFIAKVMTPTVAAQRIRGRETKRSGGSDRTSSAGSRSGSANPVHRDRPVSTAAGASPAPLVIKPEPIVTEQSQDADGESGDNDYAPQGVIVRQLPVAEVVRDGATGVSVIETTDAAGIVTRSAVVDGRTQILTEGVEIATFVPHKWQSRIDISKPMGPSRKKTAEIIMQLCELHPTASIKRAELKRRIAKIMNCREGTVADLLTEILHPQYTGKHILKNLAWKTPSE